MRSLLLLGALVLAACSAPSSAGPVPGVVEIGVPPAAEPAPPPRDRAWKVGAYLGLTGLEGELGIAVRDGIRLALDAVNARGGAQGRPISVVFEDDRSDPKEAVDVALRLIDREQVVALLGDVLSAHSHAAGVVANRRGVPMITPTATNPEVTKVGPFVFRACFDDDVQGRAAARFVVQEARKKRIGLLVERDDIYSTTLGKGFREEASRLGGSIVVEQSFVQREADFPRMLDAIAAEKPDVVFAPVFYEQMPAIAKAALAAGLRGDQLVGGDGWGGDALLRDAGNLLEGAIFTDHWAADAPWPASRAFLDAYQQRFHRVPTSVAAAGYDAALVLADALGRAKGETPDAVRQAIAETRGLAGATGTISMGKGGEPEKDVVVVRIEGRQFRFHAVVRAPGR